MFVYFKHEDKGKGPELARLLVEALAALAADVTGRERDGGRLRPVTVES